MTNYIVLREQEMVERPSVPASPGEAIEAPGAEKVWVAVGEQATSGDKKAAIMAVVERTITAGTAKSGRHRAVAVSSWGDDDDTIQINLVDRPRIEIG